VLCNYLSEPSFCFVDPPPYLIVRSMVWSYACFVGMLKCTATYTHSMQFCIQLLIHLVFGHTNTVNNIINEQIPLRNILQF